jgi:hypothetical protein
MAEAVCVTYVCVVCVCVCVYVCACLCVLAIQGFDKLCLTHCGEIDGMLKDASKGQRKSIELAQKVVRQQLAALKVEHGSNSLFKTLSAKFVGKKAATAATHPSRWEKIEKMYASEQMKVPEGEKLQAKDAGKGACTKSPNLNAKGYCYSHHIHTHTHPLTHSLTHSLTNCRYVD